MRALKIINELYIKWNGLALVRKWAQNSGVGGGGVVVASISMICHLKKSTDNRIGLNVWSKKIYYYLPSFLIDQVDPLHPVKQEKKVYLKRWIFLR